MRRLLTQLVFVLLSCTLVMAQEITVKSFTPDPMDLTASTQRRNDVNGNACALIRVLLAKPGATFHGNVMGDTPYSQSEYHVYMTKGTKMLRVKLDGYLPLDLQFANYGITALEGLSTYRLVLTLPNVPGQNYDDGKTYFTLTVTPNNASVRVDGNLVELDNDGTWMQKLDRGPHSYRVEAAGHEAREESFTLGTERKLVQISLVSTKATITLSCPTSGAEIYINDKKHSSSSTWTGMLVPGSYVIEARKDGYYSQQQSIEVGAKQSRTIELPALIARVGQLDVAYKPVNTEVWIDGTKAGTSPDMFRNLTVGSHKVELRKEGYQSKTMTVTIAEGQTASLSGSLESASTNAAVTAATTSSTGAAASTSSAASSTQQTFTVNGVSFTMVRVEGGTFTMGATKEQGSDAYENEKPAHDVTLSSFSIGETEVTQALWKVVMGQTPTSDGKKWEKKYGLGAQYPAYRVSWQDCQDFIKKLNNLTGRSFRLPTEAEWEYAARGGNRSRGYKYSGSNTLEKVAWYQEDYLVEVMRPHDNSQDKGESSPDYGTHPVGTKQSNELGLYDMSGNVREWCSDWFGGYSSSPKTNPKGTASGSYRVCRGGSWNYSAWICRSSYRNCDDPGGRMLSLGLRLVLSE